jgi:hypothetical protein
VLSLGFYGTQIEVVYVQHPALGTFAVEIDGVVMQTVNSLAGEGVFNVRATISGLFDGQHTLRVYPVNGVMAIDAFLVEQAAEPVLPTVVPTETLVPPTDVPTDIPTETPIPPTDVPTDIPTETPIPPTDIPTETPVPPTDVPTETLIPPTDVPIATPVPPTDVPTEVPADPPAEPETVNSGG